MKPIKTEKIIIIGICILLLFLSGCNSAYNECKYDCLKFKNNCSIELTFCIPPPCINRVCNDNDIIECYEECK